MRQRARAIVIPLIVLSSVSVMSAQESLSLRADLLFYGDNTEFRNPFREGETIFGTAARLSGVAELSERATIELGVFGNQRVGSDSAFELVRPVISLIVKGRRSSFVLGTLPASRSVVVAGSDRQGPHGLLPPLQRETLTFDRPYEAGLQWTFAGSRLRHEMWLDWQRLNTPDHRERFDAGLVADLQVSPRVAVPLQLHIVHEGGQLYDAGPVADSIGAAAGVAVRGDVGQFSGVVEIYGLASRYVPDRSAPDLSRSGAGFLGRASGELAGWRAHILFWRGDDFITDEGDPNYLSRRRDGTRYRGVRDYAETGITRVFKIAPDVQLSASARVHRVERHYEYSYRVLGVASWRWRRVRVR